MNKENVIILFLFIHLHTEIKICQPEDVKRSGERRGKL